MGGGDVLGEDEAERVGDREVDGGERADRGEQRRAGLVDGRERGHGGHCARPTVQVLDPDLHQIVRFWCKDARSMDGAVPLGRRPRPVADAPAVDAAVVAKAWLLALVADAPLAQAGNVPAAELARGGPALCGAILAALASDAELERLVAGDGRAPLGGFGRPG